MSEDDYSVGSFWTFVFGAIFVIIATIILCGIAWIVIKLYTGSFL